MASDQRWQVCDYLAQSLKKHGRIALPCCVDGFDAVFQFRLFQEHRDLLTVWSGPVIEVNHASNSSGFEPLIGWEKHFSGIFIHLGFESELRLQCFRALSRWTRIDFIKQTLDMGQFLPSIST
jgi:hypothetical protein